jgi:hypothetical protein
MLESSISYASEGWGQAMQSSRASMTRRVFSLWMLTLILLWEHQLAFIPDGVKFLT